MKRKQGISLIVLVITIIVMVVLVAAVVVSLNNTGIINKANQAVSDTDIKNVEQLANVVWAEEYMDGKRGETLRTAVLEKLKDYIDNYEFVVTDKGVEVKDKYEDIANWPTDGTQPLDAKYFTFDYDTTNKTATITGFNTMYMEVGYYDKYIDSYYDSYYETIEYPMAIVDGDKRITDIVLPSTVVNNGDTYTVTAVGDEAFYGVPATSGCELPEFTSLIIPETIKEIGELAFNGWGLLKKISIPSAIETVGDKGLAFWAEEIYYQGSIENYIEWKNKVDKGIEYYYTPYALYANGELVEEIIIPSTITNVEEYAFMSCTSLANVIISDGVTSIGHNAFAGCTSLTSITLPDSVTSIGMSTFSGCTSLTSISLPDDLTCIEEFTFNGCTNLTSITLPDSLASIEDGAFSHCTSLENILLPDGVTSIGVSTFSGCTSLTSISLPNNLTEISNSAFSSCTGLTNVIIPKSVTSIGIYTFNNCSKLANVYYTGTEAEWNAITIGGYNTPLTTATKHYNHIISE